ncbi:MAG: type I methionyl aminopeptidase [Deltaproteobacteria bacterium]|jgi:methionine aminopeptidase, type I (EC 3.4.11.18)|uniref:Methionine aminopeptidase n=1 Tax=Candidatus Acidulodesulfobacterium acidiphilum TaxID=2597224 RepID=A0A520XCY0_9DELT|nr:type I methionyl aminopeptidase [Deltaproteobacteria bacterium]MCL6120063.1 type I methionyl aminopeptidase [Deltaproteobacteria bacterium]MDA8299893.1 type I methionyl aminopeptidase [Deltaproteobacteria bacterium]RZV38975.1 MAG: type I methionyl aminopeptidase [Candidatus Acidulodesulfobacterium acidiphilum]
MISLKNKTDIEGIKKSGQIVRKVLNELAEITKPGIRTIEYDIKAEQISSSLNASPAFKGYGGFPYSVCVSVNEDVVHGFPSQRRLKEGDIVSLDFGIYYNGYYADAAITVPVGKISDNASKLIEVTQQALNIGISKAVMGNKINDISKAVEEYAVTNKFSVVRDFVGHGVGFKLHEDPQVPNYYIESNDVLINEGLVIAIEPMINESSYKVKIKQNKWTVTTKDKKLSAHFEHTVAVTKEGPQILT